MTLKDLDVSRLSFDIFAEDFCEDIKNKIPEFNEYEGEVDELNVFRFVVLQFDIHNPLRREIVDYYTRMYTIASLLGFPKHKGEFTEDAEKIVLGKNVSVNKMIVAYTAYLSVPDYQQLMAYQALFSSEYAKVLSGKGGKDSEKIMDSATNKIEKYTRSIFGSGDYDEYSLRRQALYQKIEKDKIELRPEKIIRKLVDEGKLPADFSPYGDDYDFKANRDLKFIGDHEPEEE